MIASTEWIVIGIIVLALFVFGPKKIPEFARAIGKAKRTFENASHGIEELELKGEKDGKREAD